LINLAFVSQSVEVRQLHYHIVVAGQLDFSARYLPDHLPSHMVPIIYGLLRTGPLRVTTKSKLHFSARLSYHSPFTHSSLQRYYHLLIHLCLDLIELG